MITFKQFLSEAEVSPMKTTLLGKNEMIELALEHCQGAITAAKKGNVLYRGWFPHVPTGIVRPQTGKRQSQNTSNFYTQLLDTNSDNALYPKRSHSLICTTDTEKADKYGKLSYVFPYDGVKLAVCPKSDIWDIEADFPHIPYGIGIYHMNEPVEYLLDYFELPHTATYEQFEEAVDSLDNKSFMNLFDEMFPQVKDYTADDIDDFKTIWKTLYNYEMHDVDLINVSELSAAQSHEVWFSGDCIVMTPNDAERLLNL